MGIISSAMLHSWEEMIIDGVNVAGCEFYEPKAQVMTCHEESITKRCDKTNCYYKQLKRLEQENAELKAENDKLRTCLQEIKAIAEDIFIEGDMSNTYRIVNDLKKIIAKVESEGVKQIWM